MMYEVLTRGWSPYTDIKSNREVHNFILDGGRLDRPEGVDLETWAIAESTWATKPQHRPKFKRIMEQLDAVTNKLRQSENAYLEPEYDEVIGCFL